MFTHQLQRMHTYKPNAVQCPGEVSSQKLLELVENRKSGA